MNTFSRLASSDVNLVANKDLAIQDNYFFYPGRHTVESPVVGSRIKEMQDVKSAAQIHPILFSLEKAIYNDKFTYLIPLNKKDEADAAARHTFLEYIQKYASAGCTEENIVGWRYDGFIGSASNKTWINDTENQWNTWYVKIFVEGRHDTCNEKYEKYLPPHVVAYHEVMHAEEIPKKGPEKYSEPCMELLTTIKTFILLDSIYKTIHGINEDVEIDYGKKIEIKGHSVSFGLFVNFYRDLEKKYSKLYLALISSESMDFLAKHFPVQGEKLVTSIGSQCTPKDLSIMLQKSRDSDRARDRDPARNEAYRKDRDDRSDKKFLYDATHHAREVRKLINS